MQTTRANQSLLSTINPAQPWGEVEGDPVAATSTFTTIGYPLVHGTVIGVGGDLIYFKYSFDQPVASSIHSSNALSAADAIISLKELINNEAASVGGVVFKSVEFSEDVTASFVDGDPESLLVTSNVTGEAGNSIAVTYNLGVASWSSPTLIGGATPINLQPIDLSDGSLKSSIWRGKGRFFTINLSSEKTDLYWEESGATIIPKSI